MGWEEWRPKERLLKLAAKYPKRFQRDGGGKWHFVPGERFAEPLGLFFRLRSSAEINLTLVRNLVMLQDYLREDSPPIAEEIVTAIVQLVRDEPGIMLDRLLRYASADDLYALIATGRVYVDWQNVALADGEHAQVFADELTSLAYQRLSMISPGTERAHALVVEPGSSIIWDGRAWRIVNAGDTCIALANEERQVVDLPADLFERLVNRGAIRGLAAAGDDVSVIYEIIAAASTRELQRANDIFDLVHSGAASRTLSPRTLRHWKRRIREAETESGRGYLSLLRRRPQGNRKPKLSARSIALMDRFIEQRFETLVQRRRRAVYGELARACELDGMVCPSFKTFCRRIRLADRYLQTLKRRGPRAAYQMGEFVSYLDRGLARHGDRPFEVVHIDHTEVDIEVRHSRTGKVLGRPWLTFMMDAYSRRILAFHLTFDPPSYRSCMAVIRECARRHHRLPDTVVVDGGKEFANVYFESLLAS